MPEPLAPAVSPRRLKLAGLIALVIAALVIAIGVFTRVGATQQLKADARAHAAPTVRLAKIEGGGERKLVLPGDMQANFTAPIHARVSGYLKRWYVDIGTPVKAGQVLADVDTPDLDQQVLQARADLATAQANESLARTTAKRWAELVAQDAVSRQEADEKAGDLTAKSAMVNGSRANLNRLLALEGFKRITAPFDGVVTARNTDIGALISAGSPGAVPLFTVADQRKLRIYIRAPQSYSALIGPGAVAEVTVPEYPGEVFRATVTTDARAVAAQTGAVLMQLQLDNAQGRLKSGAYAQVIFKLSSAAATTRVPATALQFRHDGPVVAIVGPDGKVVIRPVTIARDLGTSVEIATGVTAKDRVIDNPPEALAAGDSVRIAARATPEKAANAGS